MKKLSKEEVAKLQRFNNSAMGRALRQGHELGEKLPRQTAYFVAMPLLIVAIAFGLVAQYTGNPAVLVWCMGASGLAGFLVGAWAIFKTSINDIHYGQRRRKELAKFA